MKRPHFFLFLWFMATSLSAQDFTLEMVKTPASERSLSPNLSTFGDHFILSWIERGDKGTASMRIASWNGDDFDKARTVTTSDRMFANWADIPSVIEAPSGDLYAHWLDGISNKAYAYGIKIARSTDHGRNWRPIGWLHDDESPTQHGFVSFVPDGKLVRAFWLGGRAETSGMGKMTLRTAVLDGEKIEGEHLLDDDVCTCCPISAVSLSQGPMVVYRDRSAKEIRDISFIRRMGEGWTEPSIIHEDKWFMPGCPVNGSSIATSGGLIAVSRFTVIDKKARVVLSLLKNGQTKWQDIVIDNEGPVGRCSTVCTEDAVFVFWIGRQAGKAVLRLAQFTHDGQIESKTTLAHLKSGRSSGMPRSVVSGDYLWVGWTGSSGVRIGRVKIAN